MNCRSYSFQNCVPVNGSAVIAIITVYSILIGYVIYFFSKDFENAFCKKKDKKD